MKRLLLFALPLITACSPPAVVAHNETPPVIIDIRPDGPPPPRAEARLRGVMLDRQNAARAAVSAPPLIWDDRLEASALAYARALAANGKFEHARQTGVPQGENLWIGTRGAFRYEEMVDGWIAERADYVRGPVPGNSRSGRAVGHYTQIIWRSTARVGCAIAANRANELLVCRYAPAGNVYGRNPEIG